MFIEFKFLNGDYKLMENVENWWMTNNYKVPMMEITESPNKQGKKTVLVNMNNVLAMDIIDEETTCDNPKTYIT